MKPLFEMSYASLPTRLYSPAPPTPFPELRLLFWNDPLALELGIDRKEHSDHELAEFFSGSKPTDPQPIAQAYSGHQFGHFNPHLGDGRAKLLGECRPVAGVHRGRLTDIHLKGSGPTAYSRRGDGRATLSACLRETIVGEGLHGLGIPCSRILAVIGTGETVHREDGAHAGAIAVRVASSHLRVGTFEHVAARRDVDGLRQLLHFTMQRHAPDLDPESGVLEYFGRVVDSQARLVAQWLGVGFVHGVMNTDNTFLSGETLDLGPCAFIDTFEPYAVFSRIDTQGRYAFMRQPHVLKWNLSCWAQCLLQLPLLSDKKSELELELNRFSDCFEKHYLEVFAKKLGLVGEGGDARVRFGQEIAGFLESLEVERRDFTTAFRSIAGQERYNPAIVPRNHAVEACLRAAQQDLDFGPTQQLVAELRDPFSGKSRPEVWVRAPEPHERVTQTHCNT